MKTYGMIVNPTPDEERAARERVISHLANKLDADERVLAIEGLRYLEALGYRDQRMTDTFERKAATPAEREARKAFKEADTAKAMTEHERAQKAFLENRERLRALRLARDRKGEVRYGLQPYPWVNVVPGMLSQGHLKYSATIFTSACIASLPLRFASITRRHAFTVSMSPRSFAASSTHHTASTNSLSGGSADTLKPLGSRSVVPDGFAFIAASCPRGS